MYRGVPWLAVKDVMFNITGRSWLYFSRVVKGTVVSSTEKFTSGNSSEGVGNSDSAVEGSEAVYRQTLPMVRRLSLIHISEPTRPY